MSQRFDYCCYHTSDGCLTSPTESTIAALYKLQTGSSPKAEWQHWPARKAIRAVILFKSDKNTEYKWIADFPRKREVFRQRLTDWSCHLCGPKWWTRARRSESITPIEHTNRKPDRTRWQLLTRHWIRSFFLSRPFFRPETILCLIWVSRFAPWRQGIWFGRGECEGLGKAILKINTISSGYGDTVLFWSIKIFFLWSSMCLSRLGAKSERLMYQVFF